MRIDAEFNMVSRLFERAVDKQNWQSFIKIIKEIYQNDDLIEIKTDFLEFKADEHSKLSMKGHKFLRFSSKISKSQAKKVKNYIDTITLVARTYFGSRVQYWNETFDRWDFYSWQEVNDSLDFYKQVCNNTLELNCVVF